MARAVKTVKKAAPKAKAPAKKVIAAASAKRAGAARRKTKVVAKAAPKAKIKAVKSVKAVAKAAVQKEPSSI